MRKSLRTGTASNKVPLPLSLAKGELGHHYRFWLAGGEQWQIVNVMPGEAQAKRMVEESSLAAAGRLSQFLILAMFLSGPWLGVWILHGNHSSSLLLDAIPFTDPLITLQSPASGHLPATVWR